MVNTSDLITKMSGTPKYGSRILVIRSELKKELTINGVQIYLDNGKYYFRHPEDDVVYICIGAVGVCDKLQLIENFAKIISLIGLTTKDNKLVHY